MVCRRFSIVEPVGVLPAENRRDEKFRALSDFIVVCSPWKYRQEIIILQSIGKVLNTSNFKGDATEAPAILIQDGRRCRSQTGHNAAVGSRIQGYRMWLRPRGSRSNKTRSA